MRNLLHRNGPTTSVFTGLVSVLLLLSLSGCTKKELDRNTALKLLQAKSLPSPTSATGGLASVVGSFQGYTAYASSSGSSYPWYQQLISAGVITCGMGPVCQPGPSGGALQMDGSAFRFVAGTLTPLQVTGVAQTGPASAIAQVRLEFWSSPFYAQYRNALDHLTAEAQTFGGGPVQPQTQGRAGEAAFQRFDDGWRLQSFEVSRQ
jgi:hypothetical protein